MRDFMDYIYVQKRLSENVYEYFEFHMQRNTGFEGFEKGSNVGKAIHLRDDFGSNVWPHVTETQKCGGELRLHMWKLWR